MPIKVFFADNHLIIRAHLRKLLEFCLELTVVGEAADGEEAMRQVAQCCPDVAILDLLLPKQNGIQVACHIRQHNPATQVIILSLYDTPHAVVQALQMGARGYVLKEMAGRELIEAIHAVYAGEPYLSVKLRRSLDEALLRRAELT